MSQIVSGGEVKPSRLYGGGFVCLDGKLIWQSGRHIDARLLQQAIVDIPAGSSTISLNVVHDMTSGVWGQAGFMKE